MSTASETVQFTNTAARLQVIFWREKDKRPCLKIMPGATVDLSEEQAGHVRASVAFKAGEIREGKVLMPAPRHVPLPEEIGLALKLISAEKNLKTLQVWNRETSKPELTQAVFKRIQEL